jgi:hypothetical protein
MQKKEEVDEKPKPIETQIDSYPNQIHHQALSVLYA